ncbi:MAG: ATP-binding protein [Solirubrobacteraceae bacterium]
MERERELECIDALIERVVDGAGAVGSIEGPAGIGKTTLLSAARARALGRGVRVLDARGGELQRESSFAVVRELFAPALAPGSEWSRKRALADAARLAMPALGLAEAGGMDSRDGRFATVYGLYWLAINLARDFPLLLMLDDAHAVDDDSLHWFAYLLRNVSDTRLGVLLAARPNVPGVLEQAFLDETEIERIVPGPFTLAGVNELIEVRLGQPEPPFVEAVFEATGGVPFLVAAIVSAMAAGTVSPSAASVAQVRALGARGVALDLVARLRRVAPGAIEVAQAATVLGVGAERHRVALLAGTTAADVASVADALTSIGLTNPGWPLRFAHPLIEEALKESMSAGRLSHLRSEAATLIAAERGPLEEIAAHLLLTEPTGEPTRAAMLLGAGRRALREGAPLTAATYLRRAVREPPPREQLAATLLELGRAETQADQPSAIDHLGEAAELAETPDDRARILWELTRALMFSAPTDQVFAVSRRALECVGDHELELEIRAERLSLAQMDALPAAEVETLVDQIESSELGARTLSKPPGEERTVAERKLLGALAFIEFRRGDRPARSLELAELATGALDGSASEFIGSPSFVLAQYLLICSDQLDTGRRLRERVAEWAVSHGAPSLFGSAMFLVALAALHTGQLHDVDDAVSSAIEAAAAGGSALIPGNLMLAGLESQLAQGQIAQARATMNASGLAEVPAEQIPFSAGLFARGNLLHAEGDTRKGLNDVLACGERLLWNGSINPATIPWRSVASMMHADLGEHERALELADENLRLARASRVASTVGVALRTHGAVIGGAAGVAELREAVDTLAASPARLEHAAALVELGAALRRAGQRRTAREALRQGHKLAASCAAAPIVARAEDELRASGARLISRPASGLDALTPSERRIATLAASERTNRQIAQSLFLSMKTVEMHLGRTYRKLGISSRAELSNALRGDGDGRAKDRD